MPEPPNVIKEEKKEITVDPLVLSRVPWLTLQQNFTDVHP